ncbi:MAG TPA: DUF4325 domain-containing protein [bacterium]|nr:DUF4325 domain-containing protein [bacterium]
MTVRETILRIAEERKTFRTADVLTALHGAVSRQLVHRAIHRLVAAGRLVKAGTTRGATYARPEHAAALGFAVRQRLANRALQEHEVLDALRAKAPFLRALPDNVGRIFAYGFQEMMNNAIEHSASPTIDVEVRKVGDQVQFTVNDVGVGVFGNIMEKRSLASEQDAIEELLKGKTTTQPTRHSGEGIFFTSRTGDVFVLESHAHRLRFDNRLDDVYLEPRKPFKRGTKVTFSISGTSRRRLNDVFNRFQARAEEPAFDRSEVKVDLYAAGSTYLSRSQARRILGGLEKFRSVTLDFENVPAIGQAFADEIFRVYRAVHPEVAIVPVNMNETVRFMVERARRSARG